MRLRQTTTDPTDYDAIEAQLDAPMDSDEEVARLNELGVDIEAFRAWRLARAKALLTYPTNP